MRSSCRTVTLTRAEKSWTHRPIFQCAGCSKGPWTVSRLSFTHACLNFTTLTRAQRAQKPSDRNRNISNVPQTTCCELLGGVNHLQSQQNTFMTTMEFKRRSFGGDSRRLRVSELFEATAELMKLAAPQVVLDQSVVSGDQSFEGEAGPQRSAWQRNPAALGVVLDDQRVAP